MPLRTPIDLTPRMTARRDAREVGKILRFADLDPKTGLGLELATMLATRTAECRDLFSLRGVRTRRTTVLLMAARSLARDESQWTRLEALRFTNCRELLAAIALLTERVLAPEARLPRAEPPVRADVAAFDPTPMVAMLRNIHLRGSEVRGVRLPPASAPPAGVSDGQLRLAA